MVFFSGVRGLHYRGGEQVQGPEQGEGSAEGSRRDRDEGGAALLFRQRSRIEQLWILRTAGHSHTQGLTFNLLLSVIKSGLNELII